MILKESLQVETSVDSDRAIELTVRRRQGTSGRVVVSWHATTAADVSAVSVLPRNGTVCYQFSSHYA